MNVRQRHPRITDEAHLAYVRTLPCRICGKPGSDPAHIRSPALAYGKEHTGMGEKPDDFWVLPLCRHHHMEQHARGDELAWWASYGIDPHAEAVALCASRPAKPKRERRKREKPTPPRKPPDQRRKVSKGKPLESRSSFAPKGSRKFPHPREMTRRD